MADNMQSLIEEAINTKNNKNIEKISSILGIDDNQSKLFLKYFHKFDILSSLLDSNYTNYFNKICLIDLREKDEITDEVFAKAIITFIKEKRKNKKLYYINIQSENDINIHSLILSQLDYNSFIFTISYDKKLDLTKYLKIFNYISNLDDYEYAFESLTKELIDKEIDSPKIFYVNLNDIPLNKLLQYSRKYPNRIKYIDFYDFKEYAQLEELLELNKESLICYPHSNIKYLIPLKNAYIFNISEYGEEINYDLTKITSVNNIWTEYGNTNYDHFAIEFLNKCPNVEKIQISETSSENLLNILRNINCPKVKEIISICENLEKDQNWSKIFQNMPLLEKISIKEHHNKCWAYEISPIFTAEKKRLAFPLLEQLILNYLKGSPDRDICLEFDDEFDQFWDYFKDKKEIISRISKLDGDCINISLDTYFKAIISKNEPKLKDAKYYYCIVEKSFDKNIFDFVKKNKIEYLFILNGGNVNCEEFKECEELKFVFDKNTKTFLLRDLEKNILEKI